MLLTWHITMDAAMQELMRQNAELLMQLQQQNLQAFQQLIEQIRVDNSGVKGDLRDRVFREIGVFHGDETRWKEWSVKFRAATKESNMKVFEALKWSEACSDEITAMDVTKVLGERGPEISTMVYNRIIHHLEGPPLTIHQGVGDENGLEVWRLLNKRYSPVTPMRGIQLMLKVMNPGKILKGRDIQACINKWEGYMNTLERDYKETISNRMRIGILVRMMPDDMQDVILQHADRLVEYKQVREKAIGLIDARERLKDPDAMDVGFLDGWNSQRREDDHSKDLEDVNAVTRWDTKCYRCGGLGHRASDCATPKGKGGEKGGRDDKGKARAATTERARGSAREEETGGRAPIAEKWDTSRLTVGLFTQNSSHGRERRWSMKTRGRLSGTSAV